MRLFSFCALLSGLILSSCSTADQEAMAKFFNSSSNLSSNNSSTYKKKSTYQPPAQPPVTKKTYKPKPSYSSSKIYNVRTTAYCDLENEPGAVGNLNAIGTQLRYGYIRSAAADWSRYPLGTQFRIVGESNIYEVDDFGSALVGTGTLDLYRPTLSSMNAWGLRYVDIEIVKWGSYERSAAYLKGRTHYPHTRKMYASLQSKL